MSKSNAIRTNAGRLNQTSPQPAGVSEAEHLAGHGRPRRQPSPA